MLTYLGIIATAHCKTQRGAIAVEYGLLVASVFVVAFAGFKLLGTMTGVFNKQNASVSTYPAN